MARGHSENVLSVHLVISECSRDDFLKKLKHDLHEEFEIIHTTIQLEDSALDDNLQSN